MPCKSGFVLVLILFAKFVAASVAAQMATEQNSAAPVPGLAAVN
jgi:hypothetical protein